MPENTIRQALGYHGVDSAKYKKRADGATVTNMPYIKNISLDRQINITPQYANNRLLCNITSDNGYTGNLGTTAQDADFETELGMIVRLHDGSQATVNRVGSPRMDYYYEFNQVSEEGVTQVAKVWLLNVEFREPSQNHATDTDSKDFGEYIYPFTVYGDRLLDSDGKTDYVDDNGNKLTCYRIISLPGDTGYDSFESAVPTPKLPANP